MYSSDFQLVKSYVIGVKLSPVAYFCFTIW